jgi:rubrerythrin
MACKKLKAVGKGNRRDNIGKDARGRLTTYRCRECGFWHLANKKTWGT